MHARSTLIFLLIWVTFIWASTFGHMLISGLDSVEVAGSISTFLVLICYSFCGLLVSPTSMPKFWIFVYRVNPFTYLATGFLSTSLARAPMQCAANEFLTFAAPHTQTCAQYMRAYLDANGGVLLNPNATGNGEVCRYCQYSETDQFLASFGACYSRRWIDFGLLRVYVAFNTFMADFLYWLLRVPKRKRT